jgi:DNA mismatch repair protein MutL
LKPADIAVLDGNKDFFDQMGIEIEHFGGNTFNIHSVPAAMAEDDLVAMIEGLIDDLRTHGSKGDYFTRREKILTYFACRSAVKFGDELSLIEIESLLKKWLATNNRFTCPHGRPALLQLTKGELWKRFGRDYAGMQKNLNWAELGC